MTLTTESSANACINTDNHTLNLIPTLILILTLLHHALVTVHLNIVTCPRRNQSNAYKTMLLHRLCQLRLSLSHCRRRLRSLYCRKTSKKQNIIYKKLVVGCQSVWLHSLVVERRTYGREVPGLSLTHCAVEYGHGQAADAHLPLSPSSIIWYYQIHCVIQPSSLNVSRRDLTTHLFAGR